MNNAGFVFTGVKELIFPGKKYVIAGYGPEEKAALITEIVKYGGTIPEPLQYDTDYLIVNENAAEQPWEYKQARYWNRYLGHIGILSGTEFYALLRMKARKKDKPAPRPRNIPAGGGLLRFQNTAWVMIGMNGRRNTQKYENEIISGGGCVTRIFSHPAYCIYDPESAEDTWELARARGLEAAGQLVLMPEIVYLLWRAEDASGENTWPRGRIEAAAHYLTHRQAWENSTNGADRVIVEIMKKYAFLLLNRLDPALVKVYDKWLCRYADRAWLVKKHLTLLEHFFLHDDFPSMFTLLSMLSEEEKEWKQTGYSDGQYVLSLTDRYLERVTARGKVEQTFLFLEQKHACFPEAPSTENADAGSAFKKCAPVYRAPGTVHIFGRYPQTELCEIRPIEWTVLAEKEGKTLLISKYALDQRQYNRSWVDTTWEECSLRSWLNGEFTETAFTAEERACIATATVDNSRAQGRSDNNGVPGRDTEDKVFLLSYAEAKLFFDDDAARVCAPTDYAVRKGTALSDYCFTEGHRACAWWLRSPGNKSDYAMEADFSGSCSDIGVCADSLGVRPALWVMTEVL